MAGAGAPSFCHISFMNQAVALMTLAFLGWQAVVPWAVAEAGSELHSRQRLASADEGIAPSLRLARPAKPAVLPRKHAAWHDEEQALLQSVLRRPERSPPGRRAAPPGGGRVQPRRSLAFYQRPWPCKDENGSYPSKDYPESELIDWNPAPDRYLLAVCHFGQLNNQIWCLMNHIIVAAMLNRTLVIPPHSFADGPNFGWSWDLALDLNNARRCLGPDAIVSLAELRARLELPAGAAVALDAQVCFEPRLPRREFCDAPNFWSVGDLNLSLAPGEPRVLNTYVFKAGELERALAPEAGARVLALEDMFQVFLEAGWNRALPPLRSACGGESFFRAHPAIRQAAEGIAGALLGGASNFIAIHFRRGDFYVLYESGVYPELIWPDVPRVARTLARLAAARNVSRVFVATNAHVTEIQFLIKVLKLESRSRVELMFLPRLADLAANVTLPWAQPWLDLGFDDNNYATAILEKLVCVQAGLFIGTSGSSFSDEVYRTRWAEGKITCEDGNFQDF